MTHSTKTLWLAAAALICTAGCSAITAKPIIVEGLDGNPITIAKGSVTSRTVVKTEETVEVKGAPAPVAESKTERKPIYGTKPNSKHAEWEKKKAHCDEVMKKLGAPEDAKECFNPGQEPPKTIRVVVGHEEVTVPAAAPAPAQPVTKVTTVVQETTRETEGGPLVAGFHEVGGNILDMQAIETGKVLVPYGDLEKYGTFEEAQTVGGASRASGIAGLVGAASEAVVAGSAAEIASKYKPDQIVNNVSANAEACATAKAVVPQQKMPQHSKPFHGYGR